MDKRTKLTEEDIVDAARDVAAKLKKDVADSLTAPAQDADAARKAARAAGGWQVVSQVAATSPAAQAYIGRIAAAINRNIAGDADKRPALSRSRELQLAYARFALESASMGLEGPSNAVALASTLERYTVDHDIAVFELAKRAGWSRLMDELVPSLAGSTPLYPASAEEDDITAVGTVTAGMEAAMASELRADARERSKDIDLIEAEDYVHRYCKAEMSEDGLWDNALSFDRYSAHIEESIEEDRYWREQAQAERGSAAAPEKGTPR